LDSSFPSSSENRGGYPGNGLVAWQGGWNSSYQDTDPLHDSGHNSYIYWACKHLNYTYKNDAAATAMAPDSWSFTDRWPEIPYLTALLNNYVNQVFHCWDHFYNPDYPNGIAGWANVFAATHADMSKTNYSSGNYLNAAQDLGHASHYMTDVANPMHTGQAVNQIIDYINQHDTHREYEDYVSSNWSSTSAYKFGDLVKNNNYSYRVRSPDEATINIATFSHAYVDTLYYKVKNQPGTGFYTDPTVKNITENCVLIAARYTGGLVEYTRENDIDEIPIADFDANPQSGSAPLSVNFIDKSHYYGSLPTTWRWDFGDGFTSDEQHPHQKEYQNNGNYTVKLTVSNANGQSNKTMIISVVGSPAPQADFNYATVGPSTIHFTDISTNSPTSWVWDFGDGSNASVEQNPTHQYSGGIFATVRLFASNVYGATIREEMVLVLNPWPIADFIPSTTSGPSPLSVQFTDNSTNYADNWTWDFGDNSPVSYQRNTSHTYNNPGNYSAVLTASNSYGNNTNTKVISVIPPPLFANFTANSTSGRAPLIVQFTDTSTGTPIIWNWSFGDGQTSTTQNPVHTFTQGGAYTIALNVTNATGSNSSIRTDYVIVNGDKVGVFRNSSGYGYWYLDYNNDGVIDKEFQFGSTADIPVVGDWDGNGTSDAGVFRPPSGYWYLDTNKNSSVEYTFPFGKSGDIPVVGDWDGDGISDIGVFRPPSGYWYLDTNKNSSVEYTFPFGKSGDIPVVGDWDGNGTSDAGIFRPSSGFWYLDTNKNSSVEYTFPFGKSGDIPVVGDWNGDGTSDAGVFRPSETNWYLDTNKINGSEYVFQFGTTSDIPVVGDWDGSGISDAGVFRPANGNWYLNYNKQNSTVNKSFHFGINNDTPKAGNWI
jgi:PKD repeat protein